MYSQHDPLVIEPPVIEQTLSRWWPPLGAQVPGKDAPQPLTQNHPQFPHCGLEDASQPNWAVWHTRRELICSLARPCACSSTQSLIHLVAQTLTHSLTRPPSSFANTERSRTQPTCQWSQGLTESRSCFHSFSCHSIGCRNIDKCVSEEATLC